MEGKGQQKMAGSLSDFKHLGASDNDYTEHTI
jgi:hypothetical protein